MAGHPIVLFLSTKNESRSQMAEAYLRKYAGDQFDIYSAGLEEGEFSPLAKQVLDEAGVGFDGQTAKDVKRYLGKLDVRFLIAVSSGVDDQAPTVFPGALYFYKWHIDDPDTGGSEAEQRAHYRMVRDQIDHQVQQWLADLNKAQNRPTERLEQR